MQNFTGNSNAKKQPAEERKKLDPITTNSVIKKESEFKKFKRTFFAEDANTVKGQVVTSVIIPGLQRLITEIVKTGIDIIIYGGRSNPNNGNRTNYSNISYRPYGSSPSQTSGTIPQSTYNREMFSYNEVVLFDRGEAESVLISLRDQIDRYGMVSIADFYDMIGQRSPFTANKFGWRDLRDATVIRVRDGFSIDFPKAMTLD